MCLIEEPQGGMGVDERVIISMIVVSPSTGDVIWDEFNGRCIAFTLIFT
jgi:DNA mismatch repair protein MSH3